MRRPPSFFFFFFNDTATTEIYTLSLHDALPILRRGALRTRKVYVCAERSERPGHINLSMWPGQSERNRRSAGSRGNAELVDRKSTRLNSSHLVISYAVFCLKKKKNKHIAPCSEHLLYLNYQNASYTDRPNLVSFTDQFIDSFAQSYKVFASVVLDTTDDHHD